MQMYEVRKAYNKYKDPFEQLLVGVGTWGAEEASFEVPDTIRKRLGSTFSKVTIERSADCSPLHGTEDLSGAMFDMSPTVGAIFTSTDKYGELPNLDLSISVTYEEYKDSAHATDNGGLVAISDTDKLAPEIYLALMTTETDEKRGIDYTLALGSFGTDEEQAYDAGHAIRLIHTMGAIVTHFGVESIKSSFMPRNYGEI